MRLPLGSIVAVVAMTLSGAASRGDEALDLPTRTLKLPIAARFKTQNLAKSGVDVESLAYSHDGRILAAGTGPNRAICPFGMPLNRAGGEIHLLDARSGRVLKILDRDWSHATLRTVRGLAFSRDDSLLITEECEEGIFRGKQPRRLSVRVIWDLSTGVVKDKITTDPTLASTLDADGFRLATAEANGSIRVRDLRTNVSRTLASGLLFRTRIVAFSPRGETLALGGEDGGVRLLDIEREKIVSSFQLPLVAGKPPEVADILFDPEGSTVLARSESYLVGVGEEAGEWFGQLVSFDRKSNRITRTLRSRDGMASLRISPDGRRLVWSTEENLVVLDRETMLERTMEKTPTLGYFGVQFTSDGTRIVAHDRAWVYVWDVRSGKWIGKAQPAAMMHSMALHPDGTHMAVDGGGVIDLDLRPVLELP